MNTSPLRARSTAAALAATALALGAALGGLAAPATAEEAEMSWGVQPSTPSGPDGRSEQSYQVAPGTVVRDGVGVTARSGFDVGNLGNPRVSWAAPWMLLVALLLAAAIVVLVVWLRRRARDRLAEDLLAYTDRIREEERAARSGDPAPSMDAETPDADAIGVVHDLPERENVR